MNSKELMDIIGSGNPRDIMGVLDTDANCLSDVNSVEVGFDNNLGQRVAVIGFNSYAPEGYRAKRVYYLNSFLKLLRDEEDIPVYFFNTLTSEYIKIEDIEVLYRSNGTELICLSYLGSDIERNSTTILLEYLYDTGLSYLPDVVAVYDEENEIVSHINKIFADNNEIIITFDPKVKRRKGMPAELSTKELYKFISDNNYLDMVYVDTEGNRHYVERDSFPLCQNNNITDKNVTLLLLLES